MSKNYNRMSKKELAEELVKVIKNLSDETKESVDSIQGKSPINKTSLCYVPISNSLGANNYRRR